MIDIQSILQGGLLLAPLAGITDWPMRLICKRMGCSFAYSEMVSAKGLCYGGAKTQELLYVHPEEGQIGAQIFGKEPDIMADAAKRIIDERADSIALIDINMGCPARKVASNGEGSALLKDLPLAGRIMEAVAKAVDVPVTVKCRKGFFDGEDVSAEMAHIAEQSGMAAICVHGRTREQAYAGRADWQAVAKAKQACSIPVIGNGDVDSFEVAQGRMRETGCDGIMIGRAAMGNPWVFNGEMPSRQELYDTALQHLDYAIELRGERFGIPHMRRQLALYIHGMPGAAQARARIHRALTREELVKTLDEAIFS